MEIPELASMVQISSWKLLGLAGTLLFAGRWLLQVYVSRRAKRSVLTTGFWAMSMTGSLLLLCYFSFSPGRDLVGIISNLFPLSVAIYNVTLGSGARARWSPSSDA